MTPIYLWDVTTFRCGCRDSSRAPPKHPDHKSSMIFSLDDAQSFQTEADDDLNHGTRPKFHVLTANTKS